jgi:hypothetical protein
METSVQISFEGLDLERPIREADKMVRRGE